MATCSFGDSALMSARGICIRGARGLCVAAESAPARGGRKRAFRRWVKAYDAQSDAQAAEHNAAALSAGLPWRVVAATFVERTPVILRDAEEWEQAWWDVEDEVAVPEVETPNGFWAKQSECVLSPPRRQMRRAREVHASTAPAPPPVLPTTPAACGSHLERALLSHATPPCSAGTSLCARS